MNNVKRNLLIGLATGVFVLLMVFLWTQVSTPQILQGVSNYFDTTSSGFTHSTSTVNTTGTQMFSSVAKLSEVVNNTTSTITCALEATGTTAASSSVASGRGVIIGSNAGTVIPSSAQFGECGPGSNNCYRHKGAVNCLANVAAVVIKNVQ